MFVVFYGKAQKGLEIGETTTTHGIHALPPRDKRVGTHCWSGQALITKTRKKTIAKKQIGGSRFRSSL